MKESYSEILARYAGPESYAGGGNTAGVATAGVHAGPEIELRYPAIPRADMVQLKKCVTTTSLFNGKPKATVFQQTASSRLRLAVKRVGLNRETVVPHFLSGRQHRSERFGKLALERGRVEGLEHVWKLQTREPGDLRGSWVGHTARRQDGQKTSPRAQLT